jgi:SecD/SecF fusion protein
LKGNLRKYLTIALPVIFGLYLLFPTWRANTLEKERMSITDESARNKWDQENKETLNRNKLQAVKLGLDLRGGMYVTLEVDAVKLLEEAAEKSSVNDGIFNKVIEKTRQDAAVSEEPVIKIFKRNFDAIAQPQGKSLINYYDLPDIKDISDERIMDKLTKDIDEAIEQALTVIRQRVDKYGVTEPTIQKQGTRRILLELPGVNDPEEMRKLIQTTARLEFKLVRGSVEMIRSMVAIDQYLVNKAKGVKEPATPVVADTTKKDTTSVAKADSTKKDTSAVAKAGDSAKKNDPYAGLTDDQKRKKYADLHPFSKMFSCAVAVSENTKPTPVPIEAEVLPQLPAEGIYFFSTNESYKKSILEMIRKPEIRALMPNDFELAIMAKPYRGTEKSANPEYQMIVLKSEAELTGDYVTDAYATFDPSTNQPMVMMGMNPEGSERWAKITGANIKKQVAIVLDGEVYSAPTVQNKITGGSSSITGMANIEEAKLLQIVLKAGALKAPVQIIEERVVGPSLGEDSIKSGLMASAIAFALVVLFMVVYYSMAGMIANIAVMLNVLLVIGILAAFGGTLSLPGIAGIILTIGMAVDANILIYERIREEIYRGRTMRSAVDEGFKHALTAIIDSNITTMLTGLVLYFMGYGPIQGFALTLCIGILTTLFTAILVSRSIIELILSRSPNATISFGQHGTTTA